MAKKLIKLALLASAVSIGLATTAFAAKEEAKPAAPAAAPAAAAPVELVSGASARMLAETCAGCHGTDGVSGGPATPTIAGLHGEYFVEVMKGYRDGTAYATIMNRIAKGYTDEEFGKLASFFAGHKFVPAEQKFDQKLADAGAKIHDKWCEKCHAEGGKILADEEYYILAGQWTPYLKYTLEDFKAGTREMPKKMKEKFDGMVKKEGDKGVDALLSYYASQK
jgi:sulfide dehydrogenase cytochrome subunit